MLRMNDVRSAAITRSVGTFLGENVPTTKISAGWNQLGCSRPQPIVRVLYIDEPRALTKYPFLATKWPVGNSLGEPVPTRKSDEMNRSQSTWVFTPSEQRTNGLYIGKHHTLIKYLFCGHNSAVGKVISKHVSRRESYENLQGPFPMP